MFAHTATHTTLNANLQIYNKAIESDSVKHRFRLKTISELQNQFCKPKVSFWKHTIYSFSTGVQIFSKITNTVSCESPTELNLTQTLGATTFVSTHFNSFLKRFASLSIFLNIGCPRKYNSHSHQFCHLALNKSKSNTCQVSKKIIMKTKIFFRSL